MHAIFVNSLVSNELQVSDRINCGVYVFTPDIFTAIQNVSSQRKERGQSFGPDW